MADWISFLSALVIVGVFLVLARFIVRLGAMEREAMLNILNPPRMDIPSQAMIGVKNPFDLKLKSAKSTTEEMGLIEFLLNTTAPCYVTFYWGVRKDTIDSVLCKSGNKQQGTFDDFENYNDDSDLEEAPSMSAVPLEHVLQGSYQERSASEFYDCGSDYEIVPIPPANLEYSSLSNDPMFYTLIVTVEMCRNDEQRHQQLSDIVAHITVVQVLHSSSGKLTSHIEKQYVQTAEGNIFSMKKLFVIETDDVTETQLLPSSESSLPQRTPSRSTSEGSNSPSLSSELMNAVCIICRNLPVTRAFLPCRHACACGLCFKQLSYCPMCRGMIQSCFKVRDEPFIDDAESDTSSELKKMTMSEIIRGVFSAS